MVLVLVNIGVGDGKSLKLLLSGKAFVPQKHPK